MPPENAGDEVGFGHTESVYIYLISNMSLAIPVVVPKGGPI